MKTFLPKQYHTTHDSMIGLHDILVETIQWGEKAKIFNANVSLRSAEDAAAIKRLPQEEVLAWLKNNAYTNELNDIIYRHICLALLSDFCHYIFEALHCSRKGKLSVAYALLRKPFKDNLFYFEWMVADREDFLKSYCVGQKLIEPNRFKGAAHRDLIARAIAKLPLGGMYHPDLIYDLRYNKAAPESLDQLWTQAHHLITGDKLIATPPMNFNFIFRSDGLDEAHWEHLYSRLPFVLMYAVDVIEAAIGQFSPIRKKAKDVHFLQSRRLAGFLIWLREAWGQGSAKELLSIEGLFAASLGGKCDACRRKVTVKPRTIQTYYDYGVFLCSGCLKGSTEVDPKKFKQASP